MDISLRLPILSDAEAILSWENNPLNASDPDNFAPYTMLDIIDHIHSFENVDRPEQLRFIIHSKDALLGAVDIFDINYENKSAAIGILIAADSFRRKGLASKALYMVESEARKLNIDRLLASIRLDNLRSRGLFEKLGYQLASNSEQTKMESIVVEKWVKKEL